jgi:diaminohydroxyphosphoribosylaminopyrimidine deaminase/5-amino-6-(5-phosphoribosylamino)uracil reductase
LAAGVRRVVVAELDPCPQVAGRGVAELEAAGIAVEVGLRAEEGRALTAPYRKLVTTGRPWVIAKWAMTLDGKLATRTGDSRWISCKASGAIVHRLRGRVDAIVVGRKTAAADDPLLTARPPGARVATRIVLDSQAALAANSQLLRTAADVPLLVAVASSAPAAERARLEKARCEVLACSGETHGQRLVFLLEELGRRKMTNVLVEGGGQVLGALVDAGQIDEAHVFIAPKMVGGEGAPVAIGGGGVERLSQALMLDSPAIEQCGTDVYVHGRVTRWA